MSPTDPWEALLALGFFPEGSAELWLIHFSWCKALIFTSHKRKTDTSYRRGRNVQPCAGIGLGMFTRFVFKRWKQFRNVCALWPCHFLLVMNVDKKLTPTDMCDRVDPLPLFPFFIGDKLTHQPNNRFFIGPHEIRIPVIKGGRFRVPHLKVGRFFFGGREMGPRFFLVSGKSCGWWKIMNHLAWIVWTLNILFPVEKIQLKDATPNISHRFFYHTVH